MQDRSYGNAVHNSTSQVASPLDLLGDQSWQQPTDELHLMDAGAQTLDCDSGAFSLADNFVDLDDLADRETASLDMLTPAERRAQSNRLAQRRARARRKAKAVGTEAQLAVTSAELQELQSKQRALEARNSLLEKIVRLNHTPQRPEGQASSAVLVREHVLLYSCLLKAHISGSGACRALKTSEQPAASHACLVQPQNFLPATWPSGCQSIQQGCRSYSSKTSLQCHARTLLRWSRSVLLSSNEYHNSICG